jgi:site-specific DNA-methyltransferase (adenine-specific)
MANENQIIIGAGQDMARRAPKINTITCGDCIEVMQNIPDKCVNMILCDLPYGMTACKWDVSIPFNMLWTQYERICTGAIILTACQPFSSALVMSNIKLFKYSLVWDKIKGTGFLNANKMPMRNHEDILVFYKKSIYNPQKTTGHKRKVSFRAKHLQTEVYGQMKNDYTYDSTERFPRSIVTISTDTQNSSLHPTQKPVALFEYLIRTYTNEGGTILDNCIGSGTTAIACINTGRNYIGIEKDEKYCRIAEERIHALISPAQNTMEQARTSANS